MSREHMFRRRAGVGQLLAGLLGLAVVSLVALAGPALSREPLYTSGGLAVSGYDVVAYFNDGKPVEGRPEYATEWSGARWRFVTAANRDAFVANPTRYAPRYGGYCGAREVGRGTTSRESHQENDRGDGQDHAGDLARTPATRRTRSRRPPSGGRSSPPSTPRRRRRASGASSRSPSQTPSRHRRRSRCRTTRCAAGRPAGWRASGSSRRSRRLR